MKPLQFGLPLVLVGLFVACGGSDDGDTDNTGTAGTSSTPTAGTTSTGTAGTNSSSAGTNSSSAGTSTGTGGSNSSAGTGNGSAGKATGGTGSGGASSMNSADCPGAAPMDGDMCTNPAATGGTGGFQGGGQGLSCTYGDQRCRCRRAGGMGQGGTATMTEWNCDTIRGQGGNNTGGNNTGGFGTGGFGTGGRRGGGGGNGGATSAGNGGTGGTQ